MRGVKLVNAWEVALTRNLPDAWRTNPDFLKPFARALNEKPKIDLHLRGHIGSNGNAVGCHISSYVNNVNVRLTDPQPSGFPTYYSNGKLKEAKIDIKDGNTWKTKNAKSSFFPDGWDEDRILNEIAYIQSKASNKINDYNWKGFASDNVTEIKLEFTGAPGNLTFKTAYPIIN